jgi:CRP/FNR family transcriptional regulator, anaerobic regulatory protein
MNSIHEIFPSFNKELLSGIEAYGEIKEVKAGEILMRKGQYIKNAMLILKGGVKIYREDGEGGEYFMYQLEAGQGCAISMICALQQETSQITALTIEDSTLMLIPLKMMEKWMAENKSWYQFVINTYRMRFEEVLSVIDQIAFRSMDERLEFYLKRQSKDASLKIINISHQQIAIDLNSTREVISRLLKKMEQRGLVKLHRNYIELEQPFLKPNKES